MSHHLYLLSVDLSIRFQICSPTAPGAGCLPQLKVHKCLPFCFMCSSCYVHCQRVIHEQHFRWMRLFENQSAQNLNKETRTCFRRPKNSCTVPILRSWESLYALSSHETPYCIITIPLLVFEFLNIGLYLILYCSVIQMNNDILVKTKRIYIPCSTIMDAYDAVYIWKHSVLHNICTLAAFTINTIFIQTWHVLSPFTLLGVGIFDYKYSWWV
jgi:hypothetical protein